MPMSRTEGASESLRRVHALQGASDPYENLANAIVCVAADDFRYALKHYDSALEEEVLGFFRSDLFEILTDLDPVVLEKALRSEVKCVTA